MNDDQTKAYLMGMAKFANENDLDFNNFVKVAFISTTARAARRLPSSADGAPLNRGKNITRRSTQQNRAANQGDDAAYREALNTPAANRSPTQNANILAYPDARGGAHLALARQILGAGGGQTVPQALRNTVDQSGFAQELFRGGRLRGPRPPGAQQTTRPAGQQAPAGQQTRRPAGQAGLSYVNRQRAQPGFGQQVWNAVNSDFGRGTAAGLGVGLGGAIAVPWAVQQMTTGSPANYSGLGNVPIFRPFVSPTA